MQNNGKKSLIELLALFWGNFQSTWAVQTQLSISLHLHEFWIIDLPQTLPANVPARTNRAMHPALEITASGVSRNITFQSSSHAQKIPPACPSFTSVPANTTTDLFCCLPNYLFLCFKIIDYFICCFTYGDKLNTMNFLRKNLMKAPFAQHKG